MNEIRFHSLSDQNKRKREKEEKSYSSKLIQLNDLFFVCIHLSDKKNLIKIQFFHQVFFSFVIYIKQKVSINLIFLSLRYSLIKVFSYPIIQIIRIVSSSRKMPYQHDSSSDNESDYYDRDPGREVIENNIRNRLQRIANYTKDELNKVLKRVDAVGYSIFWSKKQKEREGDYLDIK